MKLQVDTDKLRSLAMYIKNKPGTSKDGIALEDFPREIKNIAVGYDVEDVFYMINDIMPITHTDYYDGYDDGFYWLDDKQLFLSTAAGDYIEREGYIKYENKNGSRMLMGNMTVNKDYQYNPCLIVDNSLPLEEVANVYVTAGDSTLKQIINTPMGHQVALYHSNYSWNGQNGMKIRMGGYTYKNSLTANPDRSVLINCYYNNESLQAIYSYKRIGVIADYKMFGGK